MTQSNDVDSLKAAAEKVPSAPTSEPKNFTSMALAYREMISAPRLNLLSSQLGLAVNTLRQFGVGWSLKYETYTIPMYDHNWNVVGILTRDEIGNKRAITGSAAGLFMPAGFRTQPGITFVTEGFTDAVTATAIGLNAVGRFNAGCGADMLVKLLAGHTVYIIADNGPAGIRGATELQCALKPVTEKAKLIYIPSGSTPIKDLREMFCSCGSTVVLNYILSEVSKHATTEY